LKKLLDELFELEKRDDFLAVLVVDKSNDIVVGYRTNPKHLSFETFHVLVHSWMSIKDIAEKIGAGNIVTLETASDKYYWFFK